MHLEPPLSVSMGRSQPLKRCSPPAASIARGAGAQVQVVGVAQHHRRVQVVARNSRGCTVFTTRQGAHGHEQGVGTVP